ncbi:MAG: dipeptidase [Planctomycetota bacterium]|nr:dipeptidase [Planctomycetota bacterium]
MITRRTRNRKSASKRSSAGKAGGSRRGRRSSAVASSSRTLHQDSLIFITHVDLPWRLSGAMGAYRRVQPHATVARLRQGGVGVAVLVIYVPSRRPPEGPLAWSLRLAEIAYRVVERSAGRAVLATETGEIRKARKEGKVAVLLSIENGAALGGSLDTLPVFRRLGVRLFGITWNGKNELAGGVGSRAKFSRFGKDAVREASRLGMLIDVSHLGDRSFADLARFYRGPLIASHSNARALCDHPRNLTDDQIREISSRGGVIGVNFCQAFLRRSGRSTIEDVLDHIDHLTEVGGIDAVGVGTDFDGVPSLPKRLDHAGHMPRLTAGLLDRGYRSGQIRKILGGNFLRVLKEKEM